MKRSMILVLLLLLTVAVSVSADGIKQVTQPNNAPSFLGYAPDRFIVVMKSDVGELNVRKSSSAVAHIGDAEFDKLADRYAVSSITKQFVGSDPSPMSKTAELAKYHKIRFESGTLEEAMEGLSE